MKFNEFVSLHSDKLSPTNRSANNYIEVVEAAERQLFNNEKKILLFLLKTIETKRAVLFG